MKGGEEPMQPGGSVELQQQLLTNKINEEAQ
jgi:hypothetical protein